MAIFIPSLAEIKNNRMEQPTEGEWYLLEQLQKLDDNYEIYFQSHINISHPDIVILKRTGGAVIIEVKDWNLDCYAFKSDFHGNKFGVMVEKDGYHEIRNPFEQVHGYKEELYQIYSSALYIENIKNRSTYSVIKTAVYFHKATEQEVITKFGEENFESKRFLKHHLCWGNDSKNIIGDIKYMLNPNPLFTEEIYEQIRLVFTPSLEWTEQTQSFSLSKEQERFAVSMSGRKQKIKGVAGSGKTLVLAQRAVNCYNRVKKPILILTFNITLKHYIRDKIAQITRDLTTQDKQQFHIMHIHAFAKQMLEKYQIYHYYEESEDELSDDAAAKLLKTQLEKLKTAQSKIKYEKYEAILIDEVQDFEYEWIKDVENLFLAENGEFVLFGDEKQNIYNRSLDAEKLPRTTISGRWAQLKESYRMPIEHSQLAQNFQKQFLKEKYMETEIEYVQQNLFDYEKRRELRFYELNEADRNLESVYGIIKHFRNDGRPIASNDICILSNNCATLRELEYCFRTQQNILSKATCESKEEYHSLIQALMEEKLKEGEFKKKLHKLRKIKKIAFRMNPGVMKLSTIHSFKGWEINSVILFLNNKMETTLHDELIYTAITRTKSNLVIINVGNQRYREFFKKELDNYICDDNGNWYKE